MWIPLHRLTFLRPQKPRDLGHIFGHILLPFFQHFMGFCFSFGSESLALVFCRSSLSVTDCVRPGVATFFVLSAAQTGFVSCHTWPTYPSLFIFACTSVHFWHYRPRFSLRNITLITHCLLITDITGRIQAMCETVWKVLFLLYIILSSQS